MSNVKDIINKYDGFIFLIIVFIFLMIHCDDSSDNIEKGTFKVNIDGYIEKSFSGKAIFENIPYYNISYFYLVLKVTDLPDGEYHYIEFCSTKLEKGSYEFYNSEVDSTTKDKIIGYYASSDTDNDYCAYDGELTVTYSSEKELKGYFDFSAFGYISLGEGEYQRVEIRISGEFHAVEGDVGITIG